MCCTCNTSSKLALWTSVTAVTLLVDTDTGNDVWWYISYFAHVPFSFVLERDWTVSAIVEADCVPRGSPSCGGTEAAHGWGGWDQETTRWNWGAAERCSMWHEYEFVSYAFFPSDRWGSCPIKWASMMIVYVGDVAVFLHTVNPLQRQLFQIAAVQRMQCHTGLTPIFNFWHAVSAMICWLVSGSLQVSWSYQSATVSATVTDCTDILAAMVINPFTADPIKALHCAILV